MLYGGFKVQRHKGLGKKHFLSLSVLAIQERSCLPGGSHWQQLTPVVGVVSVFHDLPGSGGAPAGVDLLHGGQCHPGGAFSTPDHSVKSFPIHDSAANVPDAPSEHRLNRCTVEGLLQRCGGLRFPQLSEVVQGLPCLLHHVGDVGCPGQVFGDADTEVPVAVYSLHRGSIYPKRSMKAQPRYSGLLC